MTLAGQIPRLDILGVHVKAVDMATAIEEIERWIRLGQRSYATLTGVHGIMESTRNKGVRQLITRRALYFRMARL
jgi:UDP-N-acetyl-D-mannosaminuronic acid transferase (WecB/TagA/CpsF family)